MSVFDTGIRPLVDQYLAEQAAKVRDYQEYWSASSAGYCMRKVIFERLGVPQIAKEGDERKTRVFESGHIFHEWMQRITKNSGVSVAQEVELQDEDLMIRGHFDDLVLVDGKLILYDYKTQNSRAFTYQKDRPMSYFHHMQLGTYLYMLQKDLRKVYNQPGATLKEGRILKISKDDLRMSEDVLMWSDELKKEILEYWTTLNEFWARRTIPACTCADHEGGFMAGEKFNPYFYKGEPCSLEYYKEWKERK